MREGYKMTEVNGIAEDWQLVKLGSLVEKVGSGITPKGGQESYLNQGVLFIRSQNVLAGKLKLNDVAFISKEQHEKMQGSKLISGDVLLNITGASIGRSSVVPESLLEGNVNQHVCIIRTKSILNNIFLCHFLNSSYGQNQIGKFQAGGNREGLNFQQIRSFHIPYPSLIEQQKIASILTTVDEKIEVIENQITQTQELKKGLMQQLLTKGIGHTKFKDSPLGEIPESWEVVKLGTLVEKVGSGITPKGGQESYVEKGVLFIRSQNVLNGKLKLAEVAYITAEQHDKMQGSKLIPGDVLLNITGASIGRSAVFPDNIDEGNVNQHVCIIRTKNILNNIFLCQLLNSVYGQNQIDKFQAGGNREGLNFQQIRSFDIPFPTLAEQESIAAILITVDDKLDVLQAKKDTFQEMKKGLMQQLLTGKIRVKINQHV